MDAGGNRLTKDPTARRATVILFGLCMIAAGAIGGAAAYRYLFWGDQLPGGFAISAVDLNGEGSPEYLIAKAAVNLPQSGDYTAVGTILDPSTGTALTQTTGRVEMDRGTNIFGVGFWAPDLRKAEVSGPYTLQLVFIREQSDSPFERPADPDMVGRVYQWSFTTPAYDWRSFQEQQTTIALAGPATAVRQDFDQDGRVDSYYINVPVTVRNPGPYFVRVDAPGLSLEGVTDRFFPGSRTPDIASPQLVSMAGGAQDVQIPIQPDQVYLSGIDGNLDAHITISTASEQVTSHPCCGTTQTTFTESPAFAPPPDGSVFGLRAPYLIPATPIGTTVETHLTDVVHWYDFRAPWMPIEFTGDMRDYGTDTNGDGLFDYLTVEADVHVRTLGTYDLSGTLYAAGSEPSDQVLSRSTPDASHVVTTAWTRIQFNDWSETSQTQTLQLNFAGADILAAGLSGPFDAKLRIVPANVIIDPVVARATASYDLSQFASSGAKAARLPAVTVSNTGPGGYDVRVDSLPSGYGYTVIVRIIHANGVIAVDSSSPADSASGVSFRTNPARAGDFAVAVYLMGPGQTGIDYLELPLAS